MFGGVEKVFYYFAKLRQFLVRIVQKIKTADKRKRKIVSLALLLLVVVAVTYPGDSRADTQGANNPSTASNDASGGTTAWTTPTNVTSSNNGYATVALSNGGTSQYIKATGFGFSVPSGATITGIVAEVERSEANGNANNYCQDNAVRIVKNGTAGATDKSAAGDWPTTDAYATYGTSSDLWGETWSVSDINSANFGLAFSAKNRKQSGNPSITETCRVDHIRITVHYTPPPTTYDQSAYRWFANNNGASVGSALANQDTVATAPVKDSPFRLRLTLHVGTNALAQNGENFKLQFAKKGSGTCASPEFSYADVTGSSDIKYYDNASATDNTALTSNASDPVHSAHTTRNQTYEEANNFTNSQAGIAVGEDGMWDFALVDSSADYSANYCFKAVKSTGTNLDSYGVYPEITTAASPTMDQSAYRLFQHQSATSEFGTGGIVTGGTIHAYANTIAGNYLYTVGHSNDVSETSRIEKRALSDGTLDNNFGTNGAIEVTSSNFTPRAITADSSYIYIAGRFSSPVSTGWLIEKRSLTDGSYDNNFGTNGSVTDSATQQTSASIRDIAIDSTYMYIVGINRDGNWEIQKRLLSTGALDNNFGTNGVVTSVAGTAYTISIDSTYMYVGGSGFGLRIEKRALSNGALDNNFGTNGVASSIAALGLYDSASDSSYLYSVGNTGSDSWYIEKRALSNGALDNNFGTNGVSGSGSGSANAIYIDSAYMYVPGRTSGNDWRIEKRALSDAALDNNFGTSGVVTGATASNVANAVAANSNYMFIAGDDSTPNMRIEKRELGDGSLSDTGSADVGSALANQDTSYALTSTGEQFRLRMNLHINTNKLKASGQDYKLQMAKKGSGSCASPEFSYADISSSSGDIQYIDTGNDAIDLTDNANDPAHSGHTNNNQTYEESNNFTNATSAIPAGEDGLWDFALEDDSAPSNTTYCFRAVKSDGSTLNSYGVYPEITTFNSGGSGSTSVDIVDSGGTPVASPSFSMTSHTLSFACAAVSGNFGESAQRIRVSNGFTAENWSLDIAPTAGPTASWSDGGSNTYDFNDGGGSPAGCGDGADSDSLPGQMTIDPSVGTLSPEAGCTNTGLTKGNSGSFAEGTTDSITILSGNTTSDTDCYWDLTGLDISQQIPADQPTGTYSINLTITLTAF